jgi:hypothetical protein
MNLVGAFAERRFLNRTNADKLNPRRHTLPEGGSTRSRAGGHEVYPFKLSQETKGDAEF